MEPQTLEQKISLVSANVHQLKLRLRKQNHPLIAEELRKQQWLLKVLKIAQEGRRNLPGGQDEAQGGPGVESLGASHTVGSPIREVRGVPDEGRPD